MMTSPVSQDPWDYGWLRGGFANPSGGAEKYYGPPLSMWFRVILPLMLVLSAAVVTSCG